MILREGTVDDRDGVVGVNSAAVVNCAVLREGAAKDVKCAFAINGTAFAVRAVFCKGAVDDVHCAAGADRTAVTTTPILEGELLNDEIIIGVEDLHSATHPGAVFPHCGPTVEDRCLRPSATKGDGDAGDLERGRDGVPPGAEVDDGVVGGIVNGGLDRRVALPLVARVAAGAPWCARGSALGYPELGIWCDSTDGCGGAQQEGGEQGDAQYE